jgi:hypothetical protein
MSSPTELAQRRLEAIAALEAQVAAAAEGTQRDLYERLLARLQDVHADPGLLPALLQEYATATLVPLAYTYGQAMLHLPALSVSYFEALDVAGYQALRLPLTDFLTKRLGVDAAGNIVQGGYLDLMAGNTTVRQQVLTYAYSAQASGAGLESYRQGLKTLVLGGDKPAEGLVSALYRESYDDFNRADRQLQAISAERLGLQAYLYNGGVIKSTRPFCLARNGKVFLDSEIQLFGTKSDAYPGYTNKSQGLFSGKPEPYSPFVDLGGFGCRHGLSAIPPAVAMRLRPELQEDSSGRLFISK